MTATSAQRISRSVTTSRLALLLAIAIFINYIDRGNLGTAAPVIKDELHLSATQIGLLLSAFYWTYAPAQIGAGYLAEHWVVGRVIALGVAIWSLATIATGLASGFAILLVLRLVLGIGESVAFPCSSKMLAHHVPVSARGRANAAISVGLALGPAFGTYVGGLILARFGWRALFLSLGSASLIWLWPWMRAQAEAPPTSHEAAKGDEPTPSYLTIIRRRPAVGAALGHFSFNYVQYFVQSWLPLYLVKSRGFSLIEMAQLGGFFYLVFAAAAATSGTMFDRWIARGATMSRAYKTALGVSMASVGICLLGTMIASATTFPFWLLVLGAAFGIGSPMVFATGQAFAGPHAAGRWIGFQNFIGNLAGVFGPALTGWLVDRTGSFDAPFELAVGVALFGALCWTLIVPRVLAVEWKTG